MEREKLETKKPEIVEEERIMRKDAEKQIELAIKLYARFHGMDNSKRPTFGNDVIIFWTKKDENGKSYSERYRNFVDSEAFKKDPRLQGNIGLIELDDFI